jgi:hypothetical protein
VKPSVPPTGFFVIQEPNFDDDDLEDIQRIVWRGYTPERYPRHDWYVYPPGPSVPHMATATAKLMPKDLKPKPKKKVVLQYSQFRCDLCNRWFRSITDEAEAEADYHETFGPTASDERLALCEQCYNKAMRGLTG